MATPIAGPYSSRLTHFLLFIVTYSHCSLELGEMKPPSMNRSCICLQITALSETIYLYLQWWYNALLKRPHWEPVDPDTMQEDTAAMAAAQIELWMKRAARRQG